MQTSQDVHARKELDRLLQLVPEEPAGWANLGLLLLRQQQVRRGRHAAGQGLRAGAAECGHRAAARAGREPKGQPRGVGPPLAPRDRARPCGSQGAVRAGAGARTASADAANDAEAQRLFESLAARSRKPRRAARVRACWRQSAATRPRSPRRSMRWRSSPRPGRRRAGAVDRPCGRPRRAIRRRATTPVIFLKNVLIREPEYRAALAAVSTPRSEVGEPLVRLVTLAESRPAAGARRRAARLPVDAHAGGRRARRLWAGAVWLTGEARPTLLAAGPRELRARRGCRPCRFPLAHARRRRARRDRGRRSRTTTSAPTRARRRGGRADLPAEREGHVLVRHRADASCPPT